MTSLSKVFFTILASCGAAAGAVRVEMSEVARAGEGVGPSGWTLHAITNYISNRGAMKFSEAESFALSPAFDVPIVEASACVVSSSAARRRLRLIPCSADGSELPGAVALDYSSTKSAFTNQTVRWDETLNATRLRLAYDAGATTVWGIDTLDLRFASDPPAEEDSDDDNPSADDETLPADDEIVSLAACRTESGWLYAPDFSALTAITAKTNVNGFVSSVMCHLRKGASREPTLLLNEGTTQYQGHYLWLTNGVPSGLGSYSAAQTSRTVGWIFRNDAGAALTLESVDVVYGQWGARNTEPDGLRAEWRLASSRFDIGSEQGWTADDAGSFTVAATNGLDRIPFPVFELHSLATLPERIPAGAFFAIRFVDTCPATGNNAHLGLAALTLRGRRGNVRPLMFMVR